MKCTPQVKKHVANTFLNLILDCVLMTSTEMSLWSRLLDCE